MTIAVNVPAGAVEPTSERYELARVHKENGRTPVVTTTPWVVNEVRLVGWGENAREEVGAEVAETKTRRGALTKARRLAAAGDTGSGLKLGPLVAYVVMDAVDLYVWERVEVTS